MNRITIAALAILIIAAVAPCPALGQPADREFARLLATADTRQAAFEKIVAKGNSMLPTLLLWTTSPPDGVSVRGLNLGLAEVFGRLKTVAAIPFLISHLSIMGDALGDPSIKSPEVIERAFPAARALIRIGPEASRAVIRACDAPMKHRDRLMAIFVVGRIRGVPEAKDFLDQARSEATWELFYVQRGADLAAPGH
jgi:hypothetical protein